MRPTDERGRPIGASPGGLPAGEATWAAGGLRGGRAAGFRGGWVRYRPTLCTRPLHKLAFCSLGRREALFKGFPCVLWSI